MTFTNPIKGSNGSDPFVVHDGGYYYLLTTTWSNVQGPTGTSSYQNVHVLQGGYTPYDTYTYKAQPTPTNTPNDWAIDDTILTVSGTNYFVFSGKDNTAGQAIWSAPLTNAWTAGARLLKFNGGDPTSINSWTKTSRMDPTLRPLTETTDPDIPVSSLLPEVLHTSSSLLPPILR
ncbi:hypothetical protein FRB90_000545 [Tulasnella sp. 427]|nr:hypothetical protein FRB90_000545 [Tulasnella sp. 427]